MKTAIVLTTINIPKLLFDYADNFEKYRHEKTMIDFIIVGDLKTPSSSAEIAESLSERGFNAIYFSVKKQKEWLLKFPKLNKIVPYNSDNRRNLGYLLAKERGAESIISIDDDNYPQQDKDYLLGHSMIGQNKELLEVLSENNWYNICRHLETKPKRTIYPRGFPYSKRWKDGQAFKKTSGRIVMNAGLWLEFPDVDAVTNLNELIKVVSVEQKNYMLSFSVFSPINTQNTAFYKDILPCYWYVRMGEVVQGTKIDRYGDILSGFFAQKVIHHMGDRISFGLPAAIHRRNTHDFLEDLRQEMSGMILVEKLIPILESIKLCSNSYEGSYLELSNKISDWAKQSNKLSKSEKEYFQGITDSMKVWVEVCEKISS